MQLKDILKRVAFKLDDPDQTTYDDDYIIGFVEDAQDWLFNAMSRTNSSFDECVVIIPGITAGSPNLDQYQAPGQPLASLLNPRIIRWRLPGQDSVLFSRADGPLEFVRDIADPGVAVLDSWAWQRWSVKLSKTSISLDLELSGDFMFGPLTDKDAEIQIARNANRALACKLQADIGKARGNPGWVTVGTADADEAVDDINTLLVKAMQGQTNRVGRMSRTAGGGSRITNR